MIEVLNSVKIIYKRIHIGDHMRLSEPKIATMWSGLLTSDLDIRKN